jgi:nicotinate-nucleotide pyrophosphorylase (carboxylating)
MYKNLKELYRFLDQDIGFEDITTKALIEPGLEIKARIISKQDGLAAGVNLISQFIKGFDVNVLELKSDGSNLKVGDTILELEGDAATILTLERTILNLLMKMSGIATATSQMVKNARSTNPDVIVAGTRKTTPGLQFWEKQAIQTGGGDTHRYRLDDAVLIKDNHLAVVGDVALAIEKAREYASFTRKIEIEVENVKDALEAAEAGADIIMLDNMSVKDIGKVLKTLNDKNLKDKVLIEISGGINPDNIAEYANTGVDIISSGYITHSAGVLDMSLEIIDF